MRWLTYLLLALALPVLSAEAWAQFPPGGPGPQPFDPRFAPPGRPGMPGPDPRFARPGPPGPDPRFARPGPPGMPPFDPRFVAPGPPFLPPYDPRFGVPRRDHDRARDAYRQGNVLPLTQILAIAHQQVNGKLLDADLISGPVGLVYVLKLLDYDNRVRLVHIDAHNGRVLQVR